MNGIIPRSFFQKFFKKLLLYFLRIIKDKKFNFFENFFVI